VTTITSIEALESLYDAPRVTSGVKEISYISDDYRAFIEKSPFVVIATSGPEGLDCSPRGDPAGFVKVRDNKTVLVPDRRGNNRLDTLRNIVRDPRVALLFIIPGIGNTLRINGRAEIHADPALCAEFGMQGKLPRTVLSVRTDSVYYHCPKAFVRAAMEHGGAVAAFRTAIHGIDSGEAVEGKYQRRRVRQRLSCSPENRDLLRAVTVLIRTHRGLMTNLVRTDLQL
jgi:PPOX class probable FMN-dependent enzyme